MRCPTCGEERDDCGKCGLPGSQQWNGQCIICMYFYVIVCLYFVFVCICMYLRYVCGKCGLPGSQPWNGQIIIFHIFDTTIFLIFCIQIVINIVRLDLTGSMVRLSFVKMMVMITMMVTIIGLRNNKKTYNRRSH